MKIRPKLLINNHCPICTMTLHYGHLEEDRPYKHIRDKHSIHTYRDMITCKLGREGERRRGWISCGTRIQIHSLERERSQGGQWSSREKPEWKRGGGREVNRFVKLLHSPFERTASHLFCLRFSVLYFTDDHRDRKSHYQLSLCCFFFNEVIIC